MEKTLKKGFLVNKSETEAPSRNRNKNGDFGRFSGGFGRRMGCAVKEDTKIFRFSLLCYSRPKAASEAAEAERRNCVSLPPIIIWRRTAR